MRSTVHRSVLTISAIGAAFVLVACGGDDGGSVAGGDGRGDTASVEEFCTRIEALESAAEPEDLGAAVAAIEDLVDAAPTDEVREALETLIPVLARMSAIDENDPDAIGELMGLAMDPKIMEASAVLEEFGTEQCGFTSDDSSSTDTVPEFSVNGEFDSAFETSTIRDYLDANASDYLNGGSFTSVSVQGQGDGFLVSIDASSSGGVAAVPICELLVELYDTNAPDVDVAIEVLTEGLPAVNRQPGDICES